MSNANHQVARRFIEAIPTGKIPESLIAPDMAVWVLDSGPSNLERFRMGIQLLAACFGGTLEYTIESVTAEEDRVLVQVHSAGTLINGESFSNDHVYLLRIRDERVVEMREYMNPIVIREKMAPVMGELIAAQGKK